MSKRVTWRLPDRIYNELVALAKFEEEPVSRFASRLLKQAIRNWDTGMEAKRGKQPRERTSRDKIRAAAVREGEFVDMEGNPLSVTIGPSSEEMRNARSS